MTMGQPGLRAKPEETTDERIRRRLQITFVLAMGTLVLSGSLSYRAIVVSSSSEAWVEHTHVVLENLDKLLGEMALLETSTRGFVITGDDSLLVAYPGRVQAVHSYFNALHSLIGSRSQVDRLPELETLINNKLEFMALVQHTRRSSGLAADADLILHADGARMLDRIQKQIGVMEHTELDLLAQRRQEAERRLFQLKVSLVVCVFLGLSVTAMAFFQIGREGRGRHLAERALRDSEARLGAILEAVPDALIVASEGDKILLLNSATELAFGYEREELLGQNFHRIALFSESGEPAGTEAPYAIDRLVSIAATVPRSSELVELTGIRRDQTRFPIEIMVSVAESFSGPITIATVRDISQRKKAEANLAEIVRELRSSNTELQQFAYVASHDLQEPLRMVASYTQLLSKRYAGKLGTDADEFIHFAVDGCNRMKRLIEDLLTFSRAGAHAERLQSISIDASLYEALANLRTSIQESQAVVTHDPLPTLVTDRTIVVQVLQNLISNAIKYRGVDTPRIDIAARKNGHGEWVFAIKDNGLGIETQHFEKIFLLFQRLHGRGEFEGTGIGLAICKKLVERIGGRIWVESQPGQGSTFYFTLPDTPSALAQSRLPPTPPKSSSTIGSSAPRPFLA